MTIAPVTRTAPAFAANRLLGWGANHMFALGGPREMARTLRPVELPVHALAAKLARSADADAAQAQETSVPISVAAGFAHSLFAMQAGLQTTVLGMGLNTRGQVGPTVTDQDDDHVTQPLPIVVLPPTERVKALSCGRAHSAVLTASARSETLHLIGDNAYGQLGQPPGPDTGAVLLSDGVHVQLPKGARIKDVACGLDHTLLLTDQGHVLAAGWNSDGQLGDGGTASRGDFRVVEGLPMIVKVATRADMNVALARDGLVFAWGNNEYGQHMIPPKETRVLRPVLLPLDFRVFDVAVGGSFVLLMQESGRVMSLGYGLGLGQGAGVIESPQPAPVVGLPDAGVVEVHASVSFATAVTADRRVFAWGRNRLGQLGLGHDADEYGAREVTLPPGFRTLYTALGVDHVLLSGVHA